MRYLAILMTMKKLNSLKTTKKNIHIIGKNQKMMCIFFYGDFLKIRILQFVNENYHSIKYALKGDDTTTG